MKQLIDLSTWSRTNLFRSYLGTDFPYINLGCELDVTNLYDYAKAEGLSFYFSIIFAATTIADEIENFRYRFEGEQPFLIDRNTPFATHMEPGYVTFVMVECDPYPTLPEFARRNREKARLPIPENGLSAMQGRQDILNFSAIPWVRYTHFIRTISHLGVDCNPKLSMGRFAKEGGKVLLPFSVQTHHGLMDGYHVGKYLNQLEEYIADRGWN